MLFRYPGGKSKKSVREKVFAYFPEEYTEFRDVFVGGGGIFFHVPRSKKRWINDLDTNLISVYKAMSERPEEFIALCRTIAKADPDEPLTSSKPGGKKIYNARLKEVFDKMAAGGDDIDPALRYLFVNRTVWAGRVNYDIASRMYYSNPNGWNIVHTNKMENAAEVMKDVKITNGDYRVPLHAPGEDVVVYLDPPYYVNTELNKNSQLYRHNFTEQDHVDMRDAILECPHKVVISYDNHEFIRELYEGFNLYSEEWTYCGTSSVIDDGQSSKKKMGKELIITNFEKPVERDQNTLSHTSA